MLANLIAGFFQGLFGAIGNFINSLLQRRDEQALGEKTQAVADEAAQVNQATANEKQVSDVVQAENASLQHSAADPDSLRDPDPDSRD